MLALQVWLTNTEQTLSYLAVSAGNASKEDETLVRLLLWGLVGNQSATPQEVQKAAHDQVNEGLGAAAGAFVRRLHEEAGGSFVFKAGRQHEGLLRKVDCSCPSACLILPFCIGKIIRRAENQGVLEIWSSAYVSGC